MHDRFSEKTPTFPFLNYLIKYLAFGVSCVESMCRGLGVKSPALRELEVPWREAPETSRLRRGLSDAAQTCAVLGGTGKGGCRLLSSVSSNAPPR